MLDHDPGGSAVACNHYIISSDSHVSDIPKALVLLLLYHISRHHSPKWHECVSELPKLSIKSSQERGSFIQFFMPISLLQSQTDMIQGSAIKWAMSSGVLK